MHSVSKEEQQMFEKELQDLNKGEIEFGPFNEIDKLRWFFLRGLDRAKAKPQEGSDE